MVKIISFQNKIHKTTTKNQKENKNLKLFSKIIFIFFILFFLKFSLSTGKILFKKNTQITIKTSIIFTGKL